MAWGLGKSERGREVVELMADDMVAMLEPGIEMEGKIKVVSGMIRLNTHFKGEITSDGAIVVAEEGEIEADIHTRLISIAGKVRGTVHASERLEIKEHGVVLGDIFTPCLSIDPGGFFDGQCHMPAPSPEKPAPKAADSKDSAA